MHKQVSIVPTSILPGKEKLSEKNLNNNSNNYKWYNNNVHVQLLSTYYALGSEPKAWIHDFISLWKLLFV